MKDTRGVEVEVGDRVIYFGRASSSMYSTEGVVQEINGNVAKVKVKTEYDWERPIRTVSGAYMVVLGPKS